MNAASIAVHLAAFSVLLLVPYYLVGAVGLDVAIGGIVLAIGAGGMVVGSWLAGRLAAHTRVGRLALAGIALASPAFGRLQRGRPQRDRRHEPCRCSSKASASDCSRLPIPISSSATLPLRTAALPEASPWSPAPWAWSAAQPAFRRLFAISRRRHCRQARARPMRFLVGFRSTFLYAAFGLALLSGAEPLASAHLALAPLSGRAIFSRPLRDMR